MDAPLYPPATRFEQPTRLFAPLSSRETPVSELKQHAAAWAIVTKEIPGMDARTANPALQVHLSNFSLYSLTQFGVVPVAILPKIDAQLQALGGVK